MRQLITILAFVAANILISNNAFALDFDKEIKKQNRFADSMIVTFAPVDRSIAGKRVKGKHSYDTKVTGKNVKRKRNYDMKVTLIRVKK